jgi:hypothetical protein
MGFARIEIRDADGNLPDSPVPKWASEIFDRYFGALSEQMSLTSASLFALYKLSDESSYRERPDHIPGRIETFSDVAMNPAFPERSADTALRIRKQHGEPIYTQAVIVGWSYLEVLIEDLAVGAIVADPNLLSGEAFKKVTRRASAGTEMDVAERAAVAVATLERRTSIQSGVPRFEVILEAVGLGGQPPPEAERPLTEMMNVRHVLLHRGGRADRRLLENCDWLGLQIGDRVVIDGQAYVGYHSALSLYGVSLQGRFA